MNLRIDTLNGDPDRERSTRRYGEMAAHYDATCTRIEGIREAAVRALGLRGGETVLDVACGTGATISMLEAACGPRGRVIGIEQSPEMARQAMARLARHGSGAEVVVSSVEDAPLSCRADAMLFCFTHDVLQSPAALDRLARLARPGCRVALTGIRFQPWAWAFALNAFTAWRARHYLTTLRGMREPWKGLARHCPDLAPVRHFHLGTCYLAVGRFG